MKKTVILFILTVFTLIPMQAQRDERSIYEHKIKVYSRTSKTGWIMTGIGSGFAIGGAVALATLPSDYWNQGEYDSDYDYYDEDLGDDLQFLGGCISIGLGVGLLAGGIVMGSIGTHKMKSYKAKLDNLSFAPIVTPRVQGFTLVYRF
jgi:hypothetical protein